MQFKKLLLLLFASMFSLALKAQESSHFPVKGLFAIQYQHYDENKIFNRVSINDDQFTLKLNEVDVKHYRIVKKDDAGYHVELYFPELNHPLAEKEEFTIRIDYSSADEIIATLLLPDGTRQLELIKVD